MRSAFPSLISIPLGLALSVSGAVPPNFSGNWQLDSSKSQTSHPSAISLVLKDDAGKIDFQRSAHEGNREFVSRFTCSVNGAECPFDENGHKAKVSLWYDGPALMVLKTDGPSHDQTTERKMQLSPDGKTLTVSFSNLTGSDKPETLVFVKQ